MSCRSTWQTSNRIGRPEQDNMTSYNNNMELTVIVNKSPPICVIMINMYIQSIEICIYVAEMVFFPSY